MCYFLLGSRRLVRVRTRKVLSNSMSYKYSWEMFRISFERRKKRSSIDFYVRTWYHVTKIFFSWGNQTKGLSGWNKVKVCPTKVWLSMKLFLASLNIYPFLTHFTSSHKTLLRYKLFLESARKIVRRCISFTKNFIHLSKTSDKYLLLPSFKIQFS